MGPAASCGEAGSLRPAPFQLEALLSECHAERRRREASRPRQLRPFAASRLHAAPCGQGDAATEGRTREEFTPKCHAERRRREASRPRQLRPFAASRLHAAPCGQGDTATEGRTREEFAPKCHAERRRREASRPRQLRPFAAARLRAASCGQGDDTGDVDRGTSPSQQGAVPATGFPPIGVPLNNMLLRKASSRRSYFPSERWAA